MSTRLMTHPVDSLMTFKTVFEFMLSTVRVQILSEEMKMDYGLGRKAKWFCKEVVIVVWLVMYLSIL